MRTHEFSCTAKQEKAIRHADGPAMVLAGPGSGKTFVTVERIRNLITSQGADPAHILVITFTRAAASEMKERFLALMEKEVLPVWFGTFHAMFYHILKQSAQYRDYTIITETEKRKLVRDLIHNHKRFLYVQEEDIEEILAAVSRHKTRTSDGCAQESENTQDVPEIRKMERKDFLFLLEEYQSWLEEFHKLDFDDLQTKCLSLLRSDEACLSRWQEQFHYIQVDEFQDISPVQYEIIKLLAAPGNNLFIVGDDDQSIYGFRGASPDSMQKFLADFPKAERILLDVNFRCHEKIVEAAGRVIVCNENRIPKRIFAAQAAGEGIRLCPAKSRETLQETVIGELKREREAGSLSTCAMICRTNLDCGFWAQTLHEADIPCVLREKPGSRFSHFVIKDICAYLALGQGERDRRHFLRVMNRPVRYIRRDSLAEEKVDRETLIGYYADAPAIQERVKRLYKDIDSLSGKRVHVQIHYIRKVIGYEGYLREKYGSGKAEELIKIGEEFEAFSRRFSSVREMESYMKEYRQVISEPPKRESGVQLLTMHASKGLEFDTVFLPECNEGKIPAEKAKTNAQMEEERRMFYVAMTRAKRRLVLFFQNKKTGKEAPSRFLKPLLDQGSSTSSSNSAASKNSSNASSTASYSSSLSM